MYVIHYKHNMLWQDYVFKYYEKWLPDMKSLYNKTLKDDAIFIKVFTTWNFTLSNYSYPL